MKKLFLLTTCAMAFAGAAQAASVTVDFQLEITGGTGPTSATDQTGSSYGGSLTYDDADVTNEVGGGFSVDGSQLLSMTINFIDRVFNENNIDNAGIDPQVMFDAQGTLVGLEFSEDVPNAFFFFIGGQSFSYEYSMLQEIEVEPGVFEEEQVTIAGGRGRLVVGETPEPPSEVPLPASGLLLFGGIAGLMATKRKS